MPHSVPDRPWQTIGADIMTYKAKDYLVIVDYYSKYPELSQLKLKTAQEIIMNIKPVFARHGIPEVLICDNMPFSSRLFQEFSAP